MIVPPSKIGGFLNPTNIIESLGIVQSGMRIADFGCGHGYFTIPLAKKVGSGGRVYAVDVMQESLDVVNAEAKSENLGNIETVRGNLEKVGGSGVENGGIDVVLMLNLLFQTENDQQVVQEARRVLKTNGKVIFIDWRKDVPLGPVGKRIEPGKATELFQNEQFVLERKFNTDSYHYGLVFVKQV
ncbi:MAG: class I SAM-dependent methyltransferase [Patescibacteria group bacterium]